MVISLRRCLRRALGLHDNRGLSARFPDCEFGRGTYDNFDLRVLWNGPARLRMGNYCSIAPGVQILLGGNHRADWVTTYPFSALWPQAKGLTGHPATRGDVTVGHDVWIGTEALILSGVTIGTGAVIGARAVVSRDVPPYAIVVGNPARLVRKRFSDQHIQALLASRWWDWSEETISMRLPRMLSGDIDAFLEDCCRQASL